MVEDSYQKAYSYSLRLLNYRAQSIKGLTDKLKLKKYPQDIIDRIVSEFKKSGYLDDRNFARAWVEDRMNFNPKAPRVLRIELKQKGISDNIIENTLSDINKRYNFTQIAYGLAKNRFKVLRSVHDAKKKKKRIFDYLIRRGFKFSTIYEVLNKVFKRNEN